MTTDHALDGAALVLAAAGPGLRGAASAAGISGSQWWQARAIIRSAPHLADAVCARTMPLGHAAAIAAIARRDPAAAARAERAMTGERWRDSHMLARARYRALYRARGW